MVEQIKLETWSKMEQKIFYGSKQYSSYISETNMRFILFDHLICIEFILFAKDLLVSLTFGVSFSYDLNVYFMSVMP